MCRSLLATIFVAALATSLPAQQRLSILDLVAASPQASDESPWTSHLYRLGMEHDYGLAGEHALLRQSPTPTAWFQPDEVADIVARVGGIRSGLVDVDERSITVPDEHAAAAKEALKWIRQQLPVPIRLDVSLERVRDGATTVLLRGVETTHAGSIVKLSDVVTRPMLRDFEVEIAQAASAANPIVTELVIGSSLALRARMVPNADAVVVEAVTRVAEPGKGERKVDLVHPGFGAVDRGNRNVDECGVAFLVSRGGSSTQEWTGADGSRLRLTCSARWEPRPPRTRRDVVVRCDALLNEPVLAFRDMMQVPLDDRMDPDQQSLLDEVGLLRSTSDDLDVQNQSPSGKLMLFGAEAARVDEELARAITTALTPVDFEIVVLNVAAGTQVDPTALPDADRIARVRGSALHDRWATFAGRQQMLYVADWDIEVAQSARIPDPKLRVLTFGHHFDVRVLSDGSGKPGSIAIEGTIERMEAMRKLRTPLSQRARAGGIPDENSGTVSPSIVLEKDVVGFEQPEIRSHSVHTVLPLADGSATLRRSAPKLIGAGRELVMVVRARRPE